MARRLRGYRDKPAWLHGEIDTLLGEGDGVAPLEAPEGYMLGEGQRVEEVLAVQEELLRSEGIDPTWPGFNGDERSRRPH